MFTGVIEELGSVAGMQRGANSARLEVLAGKVLEDVKLGDSIAVNGVCLTVAAFDRHSFTADVMAETLARSTLKEIKPGERVNLERALRLADRLGGHLVQGHVDGIGRIIDEKSVDIARLVRISAEAEVLKYVVAKGSIAIDGISLTVAELFEDSFSVSLIPHTAGLTTLGFKRPGDQVNLESDIIGRYVERLLGAGKSGADGERNRVNLQFLAEHGFA